MSIKRLVSVVFWQDATVVDKYTPEDKYFMLYLMTNPHTRQCGIYLLPKKFIAFEMGYSLDSVISLIDRFQTRFKNIIYDEETQEVAVLNAMKHNIITGGKPVEDLINKELSNILSDKLIVAVFDNMVEHWKLSRRKTDQTIMVLFARELKRRNKQTKTILSILTQYDDEYENVNDNENGNENENDKSYPDTAHDSSNDSSHDSTVESTSETVDDSVFIQIILKDKTFHDVMMADVTRYKQLFPDVNIEQSLRNMSAWSKSNPNKRKTKTGANTFITNWLIGDQKDAEKEKQERKSSGVPDRNRIREAHEYDDPTDGRNNPHFQAWFERDAKKPKEAKA